MQIEIPETQGKIQKMKIFLDLLNNLLRTSEEKLWTWLEIKRNISSNVNNRERFKQLSLDDLGTNTNKTGEANKLGDKFLKE